MCLLRELSTLRLFDLPGIGGASFVSERVWMKSSRSRTEVKAKFLVDLGRRRIRRPAERLLNGVLHNPSAESWVLGCECKSQQS